MTKEVILKSNKTPRSCSSLFCCDFDDYSAEEENTCNGISYNDISGQTSFTGLALDLIDFPPSISYITDYTSVCKNI